MRRALIAVGLCTSMMGCIAANPTVPLDNQTVSRQVSGGWQPIEVLSISPLSGPAYASSGMTDIRGRSGVTPSGVRYTYYRDGSAALFPPGNNGIAPDWSITCKSDKITDKRTCGISGDSTRLFIWMTAETDVTAFCVLGHDFPGRFAAIRFDEKPALPTDKSGCVSAATGLWAAKGSSVVTTRRVEWPYDYSKDTTGSTAGLFEAISLARFLMGNIGQVSFN